MMRGPQRISSALAACFASLAFACSPSVDSARVEPPLPEPADLDQMDDTVRAQYRELREELDRLLASPEPEPAALAQAHGRLGMWGHLYRDFELALARYARARTVAPDTAEWPYYTGMIEAGRGNAEPARQAFRRVLDLKPEFPPAMLRLGELELAQGRPDAAREWLAGHLSPHKMPSKWFPVESLPRDSRGKLNRDKVAAFCLGKTD